MPRVDLEIPDWVTETPDIDYELSVSSEHFSTSFAEQIKMTREEYIALKLHLAKMRGFAVEEEAA